MSDPVSSGGSGAAPPARRRLGEILVDTGAIDAAQLARALEAQATTRLPLGQTLLSLGLVTDEVMRRALGSQLGVPYIDLDNVIVDRSLARLIDQDYAMQHLVLPVAQVGSSLTVAMDDPTSTALIDELAKQTGWTVSIVTSSAAAIRHTLKRLYEGAAGRPATPTALGPDAAAGAGGIAAYLRRRAEAPDARGACLALAGLPALGPRALREAIARGLPQEHVETLAANIGLPIDALRAAVGLESAPSSGPPGGAPLTPSVSDRLITVAWIYGLLLDLFRGEATVATAWLQSRQPSLDGDIPLALMGTAAGTRDVEATIARLREFADRG